MLIKSGETWQLPYGACTPERLYRGRREILKALGLGAAAFLAAPARAAPRGAALAAAPRRAALSTDEEWTDREAATSYNNFYEFGTDKSDPARHAHRMSIAPWSVRVSGQIERPGDYALDDLIRETDLEERVYRLRCVEAWSMVIPWIGVPLASIIARFEPTSQAKFVQFETLADPESMPGLAYRVLDWPYVEGLRVDEAMHRLSFIAVGLYGRALPNQNGAPLRLVVPWKYGFKSIKSIVAMRFVETQPETSWNTAAPREYGFYANVNPNVDHPRWSQAKERRIGDFFRRDTLMFNGYEDEVAGLYAGMDLRKQL